MSESVVKKVLNNSKKDIAGEYLRAVSSIFTMLYFIFGP